MIQIITIKDKEIENLKEKLIALKYKCYQAYLRSLDDEFLRYEYADRIGMDLAGDGADEFRGLSNHKIIDRLEDHMANAIYDDPLGCHPINQEYMEACKPQA